MTTWLTVSEAAEYIRAKHSRMVRDAVKRGDLPAYTYGKSAIRIDQDDLDAWIRSKPWEEAS
jgi:excisionase family DNA binding protein